MADTWGDPEFVFEPLSDGCRYTLPRRTLGKAKHFGWVLLIGGLVGAVFLFVWMSMPLASAIDILDETPPFAIFLFVFGGLGLLGLIPTLGSVSLGIALLRNKTYSRVDVRNGKLICTERFYLGRWKRKCKFPDILRFRVIHASENNEPADEESHTDTSFTSLLGEAQFAIEAQDQSGKKFLVAPGYPEELLEDLAPELAEHFSAQAILYDAPRAARRQQSRAAGRPNDSLDESPAPIQVPPQPGESDISVERRPDGITLRVPPTGLRKGSHGLFGFGILWLAFVVVIFAFIFLGGFKGQQAVPWSALAFMGLFVLPGVGMFVAGINMGRRRAAIVTMKDRLFVVRESIFGKKQQEWTAGEILEIVCGKSGMEVNDIPVCELQIHSSSRAKFGLLSQRDADEIRWIAAELCHALNLHAGNDLADTAQRLRTEWGTIATPENSRVIIENTVRGLVITVPPKGFGGYKVFLLIGPIFTAIGLSVGIGVTYSQLKNGFEVGELPTLMFIWLWATLFGGGGAAAFAAAIITGRRRFILTVTPHELAVERIGPFGHKTFRWRSDELKFVRVVNSSTRVNDRHLKQLRIRPKSAAALNIMTGQAACDLQTVATVVNETLDIP